MDVHNRRQNEVNCSLKIPCLRQNPAKAVGGEGCCEQAAIRTSLEGAHILEDLIAPFQSIHLFTIAVIVPNIYLVSMTEVPLDKVRAAGLVIRSHE